MRVISYYICHAGKNSIKRLMKSPVGIFLFVCFILITVGMIASTVEKKNEQQQQSVVEIQKELAVKEEAVEIFHMIASVALILFFSYEFATGDKKGTTIFQMADVNYLFSAPIRPQTLLLFRIISKMGASLAAALYMVFQIPNLVLNLGISMRAAIGVLITYFMMLVLGMLVSVLTYCLCGAYSRAKQIIRTVVYLLLGLIVVFYSGMVIVAKMDPIEAGNALFNTNLFQKIPIIGWLKGFSMAFFDGSLTKICCYGALLVLAMAIMIVLIYRTNTDFYEDAMSGALKVQEQVSAAQEGRTVAAEKKHSKKVKRTMGITAGSGANTFFYKAIMTHCRGAKLGFITGTSIFYYVICIGCAVISTFVVKVNLFPLLIAILLFITFFQSLGCSLSVELSNNMIFLVPDHAFKKVVFNTIADLAIYIIDTAIPFIIATIVLNVEVGNIIAYYLLLLMFYYISNQMGAWIDLLCPSTVLPNIRIIICMFLKMFIALPIGILWIVFKNLGYATLGLYLCILFCFIIGTIFLVLCPSMLHKGRN